MKDTLIIIPVFNEEKNISEVIKNIYQSVPDSNILVVDDGSTDGTPEVLNHNNIPCISHATNFGYGAAVQTGLKYAVKKKYKIVALMDGDGQHDPKELPRMIKTLKEENLDMVIGSRFIKSWKTIYSISLPRKIGMMLFSNIAFLLTKVKIKDTTSGFQVFNAKTASFLEKIYPSDHPDAEIVILLNLLSFKTKEIPVKMYPRMQGKSMITLFRTLYYPFRMFVSIIVILLKVFLLKHQVKNA
ncbi:MAG: glycosyltransferase family 2 protein [Candidatus Aminicenantes bacterium]|nr:glycosyltransferase family 2 protein [Candidatus Aminicenantes bacterium]